MSDHISLLKALDRKKPFFVGVDSDGCAFDTMEIKHKECFIPNIINDWGLQPVSRFAREAAEFVNLYSQWRGVNRFPALTMVFDMLADWDAPLERGYKPPQCDSLRAWIASGAPLSNPSLKATVDQTRDEVLARALQWSVNVNESIARIVRDVPPFPHVRDSLQKLQDSADVIVCSATPGEALYREWQEHDLARYAALICGQELGSKKEHLEHAAGGKYPRTHVLMVGDALGDMKAAKASDFLFYPINPGAEAASWRRFHDEAIDRFLAGTYAGAYEKGVIDEFMTYLPSTPPWKKGR